LPKLGAILAVVLCLPAASASAQTAGLASPGAPDLRPVQSLDRPPPDRTRSGRDVLERARAVPKIEALLARHPEAIPRVYRKGASDWQVSFFGDPQPIDPSSVRDTGDPRLALGIARPELGQVLIDDKGGHVKEAWTGLQVLWTMARGYPGAFGRRSNALYVWIPLCLLFLLPFIDPRRPLRWLHLDLLALVAFSASLAFFNHARLGLSVPLSYLPLAYLLARMLVIGLDRRRGRGGSGSLSLLIPARWLTVLLILLIGFRVGLNVVNSNVIDVGYASVIGADRVAGGNGLYGEFPGKIPRGDTYGPVVYYAYVPFELAFPWSGSWDSLPAAHGAALAFDLATILLLWLLGRRIRGPTLGVALAYAWVAYPFTLFATNSNTNDGLVGLLLAGVLLAAASAPARGGLAALAGLTKFAPLALAPLLAMHRRTARSAAWFALAFVLVAGLVLLPVILGDGLHTFYDRTLGFQRDRESPFSLWGYYDGLDPVQTIVQVAAVGLAVAVAVLPRREDLVGLAALGAAVMIAVQLGVTHWFYLYIVWFLPFVLVALLGRSAEPEARVSRA
jgi:hypothetical protein